MGRTGKLFAHEWEDVPPDIMAIAKALGNGFPVGACLATERAAVGMVAGTHGSTFGGNPLAMAAGNAVLDMMLEPGFFDAVDADGQAAARAARDACRGPIPSCSPNCAAPACCSASAASCRPPILSPSCGRTGLLTLTAGDNVLRILPPLIVGEREIDEALDIMNKVAREWPA